MYGHHGTNSTEDRARYLLLMKFAFFTDNGNSAGWRRANISVPAD